MLGSLAACWSNASRLGSLQPGALMLNSSKFGSLLLASARCRLLVGLSSSRFCQSRNKPKTGCGVASWALYACLLLQRNMGVGAVTALTTAWVDI